MVCVELVGHSFRQLHNLFLYWTSEHLDRDYTLNEFLLAYQRKASDVCLFAQRYPEEMTYCLAILVCFLGLRKRGPIQDEELDRKTTLKDFVVLRVPKHIPDLSFQTCMQCSLSNAEGYVAEEESFEEESEKNGMANIRIKVECIAEPVPVVRSTLSTRFANLASRQSKSTREEAFLERLLQGLKSKQEAFALGQFLSAHLSKTELKEVVQDNPYQKYIRVGYSLQTNTLDY